MNFKNEIIVSNNLITLFNKINYEKHILSIINNSSDIFPGEYEPETKQSNGEWDYTNVETGEKYDAKLLFTTEQISLLTSGKKHSPQLLEWLSELISEASEYNPTEFRNNSEYSVINTRLYQIFKKLIIKDSVDENLIFFMPFPIVHTSPYRKILQFTTDYLKDIFDNLIQDKEINMGNRNLYVIYPSSEKNVFVLRNLNLNEYEYLHYDKLEPFFSYEITDINY